MYCYDFVVWVRRQHGLAGRGRGAAAGLQLARRLRARHHRHPHVVRDLQGHARQWREGQFKTHSCVTTL